MSIWGKIIGGMSGFALGGPLGAILGLAAGHAIDKAKSSRLNENEEDVGSDQIAFTTAVIVLCAKMAKADGQVTSDEIASFKKIFHIPTEEQENVGKLFNEARNESIGFEPYASQIAALFEYKPSVLEEILGVLFVIAKADGAIHPNEKNFVRDVAEIFKFDQREYERIEAIYLSNSIEGEQQSDPYSILGLSQSATNSEIKKAYRKLIRDYHPDKLISHGVPKEFVELANEKMTKINLAYDQIEKQRGLK